MPNTKKARALELSNAKKARYLKTPGKKNTALKAKSPAGKKTTAIKTSTKTEQVKKVKQDPQRQRVFDRIKQRLLRQKRAILAEAEVAMNSLPEQTVFPDLGDQASVESDRAFMLRLRSREQKLLKKVEDAIDRIDRGVFGICEVCGKQIGLKRLEARPVTNMCIDCKTEQEEEEKLQSGQ